MSNKAAFIDRDGVINNDTGHYYVFKPDDFVLNHQVVESLKLLKQNGYLIIIITNQGGISRGTYTKNDVELVHKKMFELLAVHNIFIDEIYYCPHHNKCENCLCRKPEPLNIQKAIARFNIDSNQSFMIGDNLKDVEAAQNAGVMGYKIDTNGSMLPVIEHVLYGKPL